MRILFNCSNNVKGGAVQNAANFVSQAVKDEKNEYLFVVSSAVFRVLSEWCIVNNSIIEVDRSVKSRRLKMLILSIEKQFDPDVVYTMAGPTFIKFDSLHVMGISDPYITHAGFKSYYYNRSFHDFLVFFAKCVFKIIYSRFSADFYVFQTESARKGFCTRYFFNQQRTFVVPNSLGEAFWGKYGLGFPKKVHSKIVNVICPSAYYPHKDIEIIFRIMEHFNACPGYEPFKFFLTIDDESFRQMASKYKVNNALIENIGPFSYKDAYKVYEKADVVFMPSTLETFSTTYLEAVALGMPLVVADKDFSREICADYAFYFEPYNARDAIRALEAVASFDLAKINGSRSEIVSKFGNQKGRYTKILDVLNFVKKGGF